ncbi:hypoxanthine phosphoribosyltransferase [Haoranjiania flava]|uniref:Hypoxanthine phosphoribosyltransferase n=1 Tax=Haoranjiania flava TaxID=1856322 RepID=A0AAE3IQU2_9BACT|nr:hypoxanthine phosphoribosyltransferase [Haoranjiania flava]MCU7695481.1 hypoxanthine phosphoribosyltransferase [Haoranjiania flava]
MEGIQVHGKKFVPFIFEEDIKQKIKEIAARINQDYAGKNPLFIAILNGSFMFAADLLKEIDIEAEISFIKLASYKGTKSSGQVLTAIGLDTDLVGRDVIIVEDIVDTGKTLHAFIPQLQHQNPRSIRLVTMLHKKEATTFPVPVDYVCFEIPDKFVVGYGLDYDALGRNHKHLYQLEE